MLNTARNRNNVFELLKVWLFMACLLGSISQVHAEDEESEETPESIYVEVLPAFVTNYGGPGRLRYMQIEVTLRVSGAAGEESVNRHMPKIRDHLLTLFSEQTNETIGDATGKEALRKASYKKIKTMLKKEDGESLLEDILFTSFVVNR